MKFPASLLVSLVSMCASQLALAQDPNPPTNASSEPPPAASAGEEAQAPDSQPASGAQAQASAPETPLPEGQREEVPADGAAPAEQKVAKIDIVALQKMGYKVVDEKGTRLYCKKEQVTGSRLRDRTRCLTEAEAMQRYEAAVELLNDMSRARQNPIGD